MNELFELVGGHAGVGSHARAEQTMLSRVLRLKLFDPIDDKGTFDRHRLLNPERTIIVEDCNAFDRWHEVDASLGGDFLHEGENGFFGFTVVPRRQRRTRQRL